MDSNGKIGCFSAAMTIVGAIIGAGFASGQEIWTFFGFAGWASLLFVLPLFAFLLGIILLAISSNAKNTKELGTICFGKFSIVLEWFFAVCCFCLTASMIAGMRLLCQNFPALFLVTFCGIGILLFCGLGGIAKANAFLLPILILFLVAICILSLCSNHCAMKIITTKKVSSLLWLCPTYACMNAFCALPIVLPLGKSCTKKELAATIACFLIAVIFALELSAIIVFPGKKSELPIVEICKENGPVFECIGTIVLLVATASTLLSCGFESVNFAEKYIKSRAFCVVLVLFCASVLSVVGFEKIVKLIYPAIGIIAFFLFITLGLATLKRKITTNS